MLDWAFVIAIVDQNLFWISDEPDRFGLKIFITQFIPIKTVMWSSSEFLLQKHVLQFLKFFTLTSVRTILMVLEPST